jgi:PD-(D/E)XK endonuclease
MTTGFHPRRQGDLGEAAAIKWLTSIGAGVSFPLFHSPDYDLVADLGGQLNRVQVKTSRFQPSPNRYGVQLATSGGNQSWTGVVKRFDPTRCDFLFILVSDGRSWFIPSAEVDGKTEIAVGGPKYSEFQVSPGSAVFGDRSGSTIDTARGERRSRRAGRDCKSRALVAEWVRLPPPPYSDSSASSPGNGAESAAPGHTRLSANHQLTIPLGPFEAAELEVGDRFRVEAQGSGRVVITRIAEYMERYADQLQLADRDDGDTTVDSMREQGNAH